MKWLLGAIVVLAQIDVSRLAGSTADRLRDLLLAVLILALVAMSARRWRHVVAGLGFPLLGLLVLFVAGAVLAPWSVTPFESLLLSGSAAALVVGIAGAVHHLGPRHTLEAITAGLVLLMLASIGWEASGFSEPVLSAWGEVDTGFTGVARRFGLMASPNEFGRAATICFVMGAVLARSYRSGRLTTSAQVLGVAGTLLSQSRTALAVLIVLGVSIGLLNGHFRKVVAGSWVALVALITAWTFGLLSASLISRPDAGTEELTTGTGRTELWGFVIDLIVERPIIGRGAFAAKEILAPAVERQQIWNAADAHNLLLNILLTQGLVGALALLSIPASFLIPSVRARLRTSGVGPILVALVGLSLTENIIRKPAAGLIAAAVALAIVARPLARRSPAAPADGRIRSLR